MKYSWSRCVLALIIFLGLRTPRSDAAGAKDAFQVTATKVFGTSDELVLKLVIESSEAKQFVIRTTEKSGEGAVWGATSALSKSKRFEETSWIVISRIQPNGEGRTFEKIIVQVGGTNSTALGTNVRMPLAKNLNPIVTNPRLFPGKLNVKLNEPVEIVRSEDLRISLTVGEELDGSKPQ